MTLYKFEREHCPACDQLQRLLDARHIAVEHVDAEQHLDLCAQYGIRNVPALVLTDELGKGFAAICRKPTNGGFLDTFIYENNLDV